MGRRLSQSQLAFVKFQAHLVKGFRKVSFTLKTNVYYIYHFLRPTYIYLYLLGMGIHELNWKPSDKREIGIISLSISDSDK